MKYERPSGYPLLIASIGAVAWIVAGSNTFAASEGKSPEGQGREHFAPPPEVRAAFQACATELGLPAPGQGQPPSEENRTKMEQCMTAKGFTPPPGDPRHGGRPHGPPPSDEAPSAPETPPTTGSGTGASAD